MNYSREMVNLLDQIQKTAIKGNRNKRKLEEYLKKTERNFEVRRI